MNKKPPQATSSITTGGTATTEERGTTLAPSCAQARTITKPRVTRDTCMRRIAGTDLTRYAPNGHRRVAAIPKVDTTKNHGGRGHGAPGGRGPAAAVHLRRAGIAGGQQGTWTPRRNITATRDRTTPRPALQGLTRPQWQNTQDVPDCSP